MIEAQKVLVCLMKLNRLGHDWSTEGSYVSEQI